jgi:tRNA(Ile)-lysidine synthase
VQSATFDYGKFAAAGADETMIEFRSRREGDFLPIANGRKKLQNLLVDEKVPKELRDKVMFAAIGSEILWIPAQPELGIIKSRYNSRYKLDMDTKKTLKLELICEI